MRLWILLSTFMHFLTLGCIGRWIGRKGSILGTILFYLCLCGATALVMIDMLYTGQTRYVEVASWMDTGCFEARYLFIFDPLSVAMLSLVITVATVVQIYSIEYMKSDPHLIRFQGYLSLFTFCMSLLVVSSNFPLLFAGWEGVGVSSYLLIGFWYTRVEACQSAMKAMVYNRIGDCGLLFAMGIIFWAIRSLDFSIVFCMGEALADTPTFGSFRFVDVVSFFLVVAAIGKSAQFFLHPWLADAMEGPTPVSALIHAATMVTAGIFLIIRCSFFVQLSNVASVLMASVGCLTIIFASCVGCVQFDLKKIIAYSTCSQLGYMFVACAFSGYQVALYHLIAHGFFKALLFLSAGLIIHNMGDEQDIRKMGGLMRVQPIAFSLFSIGTFSLMGLPYLSGFYSKDALLEYLLLESTTNFEAHWCYWVCLFSVALTAFYSVRALYLVFLATPHGTKLNYVLKNSREASPLTLVVLAVLAVLSVLGGYVLSDMFVGPGSHLFLRSIAEGHSSWRFREYFIDYPYKYYPFYMILWGVVCWWTLGTNKWTTFLLTQSYAFHLTYVFLLEAWLFNYLVSYICFHIYRGLQLFVYWEKMILELYGPIGIWRVIEKLQKPFQSNQSLELPYMIQLWVVCCGFSYMFYTLVYLIT